MELQELKQKWQVLDQRLAQAEIYNMRVLRETISGKAQTAFDRLRWQGIWNLAVVFLVVTVLLPLLHAKGIYKYESSFWLLEGVCTLSLIPSIWHNILLSRLDMSIAVPQLMKNVADYKRLYYYQMVVGIPVVVVTILVFLYLETHFAMQALFFVAVGIAAGVVSGYLGHQRHRQMMRDIEQSLEELREME